MKIKKASIFMATFNKGKYLPNVLYSISNQKTTFPFEVCIVDDYSRVGPELLIRKYLHPEIELKYKRLTQNVGGRFARNICLDMMDPEANVAIITSCDVIYCQPFLLEELCQNVSEGIFTMPEIIDLEMPLDTLLPRSAMNRLLERWEAGNYDHATVYAGSRKEHKEYYFFLGAIRVDDLIKTGYRENSCDPIMDAKIKELGFEVKYLDHLKAVHQHHEWEKHPCRIVDTCERSALCRKRNVRKERRMDILFYQKPPNIESDLRDWTLGQELILLGHEVYFQKPEATTVPEGRLDWVVVDGAGSDIGVKFARDVGARVHIRADGDIGIDARYAMSIGNTQRENYMVTVSSLNPDVMVIAKALALLKDRALPPWVIVGAGSDKQTQEMVNFAIANGIKIILAKSFGAPMWMYVKKARIMLQGYSKLSPAKGLICETPALSFNHPDIVKLYSDSIWYAKDNDVESFAERLDKLLDTSEYVLQEHVRIGKKQLLDGNLGVRTQEQLAKRYEDIFMGKTTPLEI